MIRPNDRRAAKGRRRRAARKLRRLVVAIDHAAALWHRVAAEAALQRAIDDCHRTLAEAFERRIAQEA